MATNNNFRKYLATKFTEFRKNGLIKYGKYLEQQLKIAKKKNQEPYLKYLKTEIIKNSERINKL